MFIKRRISITLVLSLFALLVISHVFAGDDRINMPPYHFGGDTLFCDEDNGCTLLNLTGQFLFNWPQVDISAAFEELDQTGQNTLVSEGQGTYGSAWLWVIPSGEDNGNKSICFQAFDEWGKQNDMCFDVTSDWIYEQAPLPNPGVPVVVADCSMWSVGDSVIRKGAPLSGGQIVSINVEEGTVVVDPFVGANYTAGCDEIRKSKA